MLVLSSQAFKHNKVRFFPGLLVFCAALAFVQPVHAQSGWEFENRIKRMENEIQTLSRAIYKGEMPPAGALSSGVSQADVEIRLQQIETEMRDLRGLMEQQTYEIRQLADKLERVTGDIEIRVNDLEGGGRRSSDASSASSTGAARSSLNSSVQSSSNSVSVNQAGGGSGYQWRAVDNARSGRLGAQSGGRLGSYSVSGGASDVASATYDNAFAMIKNRQYKMAQKEFELFLRDHPNHALAGNAQYWLGETYYVMGDFEQASRIFAEGYQQYPKGSKAGDNLLKLALSLDAQGQRDNACVALSQLQKEGLTYGVPVKRRADQEISRLGCS